MCGSAQYHKTEFSLHAPLVMTMTSSNKGRGQLQATHKAGVSQSTDHMCKVTEAGFSSLTNGHSLIHHIQHSHIYEDTRQGLACFGIHCTSAPEVGDDWHPRHSILYTCVCIVLLLGGGLMAFGLQMTGWVCNDITIAW